MSNMLDTLKLLINVGGMLMFAFLVLLSMPQSRLRDIVMPFVGWAVTALSVAYIALPMDFMPEMVFGPFGLIDDALALAVAIGSAKAALTAQKHLAEPPAE